MGAAGYASHVRCVWRPTRLAVAGGEPVNEVETTDFFLARQPILDRAEDIAAYELLFRAGAANYAEVTDDVRATSQVIMHAFSDLGIVASLGDARGFLNFSA